MSPYLASAVRFATMLSMLPKPVEILTALSRDYLRDYGVQSVQLFSLNSSNLLELRAEAGTHSKFSAAPMRSQNLEDLEKLLSSENICREIASASCLCDPNSTLCVTPFSVNSSLLGFLSL